MEPIFGFVTFPALGRRELVERIEAPEVLCVVLVRC
jgi:hypothetical protein